MGLEETLVVNHPPDEVFAVIGDPRRDPEWNERLDRVELLGATEIDVGTKLLMFGSFPGSPARIRITRFDPGRSIAATGSGPARLRIENWRSVEPEPRGCKIILESSVHTNLGNRLLGRRAEEIMKKELQRMRHHLQSYFSER